MLELWPLLLIISTALVFNFVNGFHDAANAIATTVETRALSPRKAIVLAQTLNFLGALVFTRVAQTYGEGIVNIHSLTLPVLFGALLGAIGWGVFTWYFGLPSSSTHALVGGLLGTALLANGFNTNIIVTSGIYKIAFVMLCAPVAGFLAGLLLVSALSWASWKFPHSKTSRFFRGLQLLSASFMASVHGTNDAQNTMGIIAVALVSAGTMSAFHIPWEVRILSALAMGFGTSVGGWRIMRTMGKDVTKLETIDGCAAETGAGLVILTASLFGIPNSTTHTISSAIMGTGAAYRLSNVRWRKVRQIIGNWFITIPGAAAFAMLAYLLTSWIF
ncbi:MAG: inorganic phosphate transporter [Patescibacteria group bacterium]|nr:inorganic phosphate transporter [Patescibacteria group bacterium]